LIFSRIHRWCYFDDVAAVFVREGGFVFRPLVGFDFGD